MASISSAAAPTLSSSSPPATAASGSGASSSAVKKPFKIRAELLVPTRLAPNVQLLHHTRSLSIQVVAHQVFLLVLACAKCYAAAGKEPPRIGVLGGGTVGTAVVMTIMANGYRADRIALSTRQPDRVPRCEALKAPSALQMFHLVPRYYDNARLARESDVLVLCMPPSQLKSVTIQIRHALAANVKAPPLVISALCGVTQLSLSKACGSQAVVRIQPDVTKIASQWQDQQDEQEDVASRPPSRVQTPAGLSPSFLAELQQDAMERDRQPLPLRLATEAIAPKQEDVRDLVQAFLGFCCRAWDQGVSLDALTQVLFGDRSEVVMAALENLDLEANLGDEAEIRGKIPLVVPNWPAEWEQDLVELQAQLAAHALVQN